MMDEFWADLFRWAWLTLIGAIVELWRGLSTRTALLEQHKQHLEKQRAEDQARWKAEREESRESMLHLHSKVDELRADLHRATAFPGPPRSPES